MCAYFYILYSARLDQYYLGHTADTLEQRLRRHLCDHQGWTARAKDWHVVHFETFSDKAAAYAREREVKSWRKRSRIEALFHEAR